MDSLLTRFLMLFWQIPGFHQMKTADHKHIEPKLVGGRRSITLLTHHQPIRNMSMTWSYTL